MTIKYVDIGIIANDGTGDDLREAFIKVNDNFEELDARIVETTVIGNAGSIGQPVFAGKINGENLFKRLIPGNNITLSGTNDVITINASDSLDQLLTVTDNGSITVARGQTLSIQGGEVISTRASGQTLYIDLGSSGILARDSSPALTSTLDANNNSIINANSISATTFSGEFQGNVWGYDIRTFGSYFSGFDFGQFRPVYNSAIEFVMQRVDVDFGAFDPESGDTVDFGYFV